MFSAVWELSCDLKAVSCVSVLFGLDRECAVKLQLLSVFTVRAFSEWSLSDRPRNPN